MLRREWGISIMVGGKPERMDAMSKARQTMLFLEEMTTITVEDRLRVRAPLFMPIGTLEAHGRHLPVGTDTLCARGIAIEMARQFDGVVAPELGYGLTNLFAQTAPASFFPEALWKDFLEQILLGFVRHGFDTIVLVNGHGGNRDALKQLARSLVRRHPVALSVVNWWLLAEQAAREIYGGTGGHAAVEETAAIVHFTPDLVEPAAYHPDNDDFTPEEGIWCYPPPGEVLLSQGDPHGRPDFDHAKANRFMRHVLEGIARRLKHWFDRRDRLSTGLRPKP